MNSIKHKYRVLLMLIFMLVVSAVMSGCSNNSGDSVDSAGAGGETPKLKKTDCTDKTGIIKCGLLDDFKMIMSNISNNSTSMQLEAACVEVSDKIYLDIFISHKHINEYTLESMAKTAGAYIYAENVAQDKIERYGMKGYKTTYVDKNYDNGKMFIKYVFVHEPESKAENSDSTVDDDKTEKYQIGDIVEINANCYVSDFDKVYDQLNELTFDWTVYDFDKENS